jgi:hypothetical protein
LGTLPGGEKEINAWLRELRSDEDDRRWSRELSASRVSNQLAQAHPRGGVVICAPVYAELLGHPSVSQRFVDEVLADTNVIVNFELDKKAWAAGCQDLLRLRGTPSTLWRRVRQSTVGGFCDCRACAAAQIVFDDV